MKRARRIAMIATLAALALLAVLAVVGAFVGAERARALFNSGPLVVFWFLLAGLLVACFVADLRLIRSPGLAAVHLGALLVLAGGGWGGPLGHRAAARFLGRDKIPEGYMVIGEGEASDVLLERGTGKVLGELPFALRLRDFRIEYYEPTGSWPLAVEVPPPPGMPQDQLMVQPFDWTVGEWVEVEGTRLRVRVLRVIEDAAVETDDAGRVTDAAPMPGTGVRAVEVEAAHDDRSMCGWIVVAPGEEYGMMPLARLVGMPEHLPPEAGPQIYLVRPRGGMPKGYFSEVEVIEDGEVVHTATLEVNQPLDHGGYGFFQADYDHEAHAYTVLTVRSNSGLGLAYAGFALLVGGTMLRCWGERARAALRRRGRKEADRGDL